MYKNERKASSSKYRNRSTQIETSEYAHIQGMNLQGKIRKNSVKVFNLGDSVIDMPHTMLMKPSA